MFRIFLTILSIFILTQYSNSQSIPSAPVVVSKVIKKEFKKPVKFVGTVHPIRKSLISSEVSGIVVSYPAKEGSFVKKGEILAEVNDKKLNIRLNEAINAKKESVAQLKLAQDDLKRLRELFDKGVASKSQLDDAISKKRLFELQKKVVRK